MSNDQNIALAKKLNVGAIVVSVAVLSLVMLMRRVKIPLPDGMSFDFLPPIHATLNALAAVALAFALYFIKNKQVEKHRKAIMTAMVLSVLFLLSYVAYHFTSNEVIFGDSNGDGIVDAIELAAVGGMRTFYLILLISHIILAAVIFPFILFTFIRGYTAQYERHKKMARWVFPIWFYVAVTGPICYLMLKPYY